MNARQKWYNECAMVLIVGLGNPGKKYKMTRHNVGFWVIDELSKIKKEGWILVKPQTFMNESGKAVKKIIENLKLKIENLIVIHDDIDLLLGKMRIVKNRGAAGHKGVESVIKELGTKNFVRFRIGIKPLSKTIKPFNHLTIESFVLQKFTKEEEKIVKEVIEKTIEAIEFSLKEGLEKAMSRFNK